jgi:hypothetical protein
MPKTIDDAAMILSRVYSADENNLALEIATSETDCAVEEFEPELLGIGDPVTDAHVPFRISPSGHRFIGVAFTNPEYAIYTWGPNGATGNVLVEAEPDVTSHLAWYDDDTIVGTGVYDSGEDGLIWGMRIVPDVAGGIANSELIMDCGAVSEENRLLPSMQFMFRGTDLFLSGNDGAIYRMAPNGDTYSCSAESKQNTRLTGDVIASQFDVSDDGTRIVYQVNGDGIYTQLADGDSEPLKVSATDGTNHFYPMFALGGEQIIWNSSYIYAEPGEGETPFADGNVSRILRANADGSNPYVIWTHKVAKEEITESTIGSQRGTNCSFGLPLGGGSAGFAALGLGLAAALRRRQVGRKSRA